jgi:ABC-type antimicrobial peptide transport system permease subunit
VVTAHVARPVSLGTIAGTGAAMPIGFALAQSPLQLSFADPVSYVTALVILVAGAGTAMLIPALRALRHDPIRALRHE